MSGLVRLRLNLPCRDYWMPRIKQHKAGHDNREFEK